MTSLFLELVSVPTELCFSMSTVELLSRDCSLRAIASPTTPPPMTACVKSALWRILLEKCRDWDREIECDATRDVNIFSKEGKEALTRLVQQDVIKTPNFKINRN